MVDQKEKQSEQEDLGAMIASLETENVSENKTESEIDLRPNTIGVTPEIFISKGLSHLNEGTHKVLSAYEKAQFLTEEFTKKAKQHKNRKYMALAGEVLLMTFYSYGAVEHLTGLKGSTTAVAANSGMSGVISGVRAGVQYGLMKEGEECFSRKKPLRGSLFTGFGISLAALHAAFIATVFADQYVEQEQGGAQEELDKIFAEEETIHVNKASAISAVNAEIDALDQKISEIQSGAKDPRIDAIRVEMERLETRISEIRDHPNNNDGKNSWWDKQALIDTNNFSARVAELSEQKNELLANVGPELPVEQQKMLDATLEQREAVAARLADIDERFAAQFDASKASRVLWEAKLNGVTNTTDSFSALMNNKQILLEALASVGAVSVANWVAGVRGNKQEKMENILSGIPDDPWADQPEADTTKYKNQFMGYNYAASNVHHMQNKTELNALLQTKIGNPEAMRVEMRDEMSRLYREMVSGLGDDRKNSMIEADEYISQLNDLKSAYAGAMEALKDDEILCEISRILTDVPKGSIVDDHLIDIPTFNSPDDRGFDQFPKGGRFQTGSGDVAMKLKNQ